MFKDSANKAPSINSTCIVNQKYDMMLPIAVDNAYGKEEIIQMWKIIV